MGTQPPDGHVPLIMQTSHPLGVSWWEGNQNRASKVQCKTLLSQSTGAKEVIDGTHSEGMEHLSFPNVPLPAQDSLSHHSRMAKSLCCGVRVWVQILSPSLTSCVALAELLNLSVLQFPHLQNSKVQYYLPQGVVLKGE